MKVLVCGSRMFALDGDGRKMVRHRLDTLDPTHVVTGGANGPDEWAREWAVQTRIDHTVLYAKWEQYGRRAGVLRNNAMLDKNPDLVLAFWDGTSAGTAHTIEGARARHIPVEVIRETM